MQQLASLATTPLGQPWLTDNLSRNPVYPPLGKCCIQKEQCCHSVEECCHDVKQYLSRNCDTMYISNMSRLLFAIIVLSRKKNGPIILSYIRLHQMFTLWVLLSYSTIGIRIFSSPYLDIVVIHMATDMKCYLIAKHNLY